jgi:hypothetical protein
MGKCTLQKNKYTLRPKDCALIFMIVPFKKIILPLFQIIPPYKKFIVPFKSNNLYLIPLSIKGCILP